MKNWFPFTDYDFYAYLTAGMIVLSSLDYGFNGGAIILREKWPFLHIVFAIAMAYIIGQVVAGFASVILEQWVARRILRPPIAVMMGLGKVRFVEHLVGRWIVGRYYELLSENMRSVILTKTATSLGKNKEEIDDPEDIFQAAFPVARAVPDTAVRMDEFRKLYGFSRNIALSGLMSAAMLVYRSVETSENNLYWWALVVLVLSITMFSRFLKFYAAYGAEILRTYASGKGERVHEG